jgi:formylglycine-generating enzyme required for sulfatase activity
VYALGVSTYQLVTGRLPFDFESSDAILYAHMHTEPTPPSEFRPDLPPAAEERILRAMAKRPEDRPKTAGMFYNAFRYALTGEVLRALYTRLKELWNQADWDGVVRVADEILSLDPEYRDTHQIRARAEERCAIAELVEAGYAAAEAKRWADVREIASELDLRGEEGRRKACELRTAADQGELTELKERVRRLIDAGELDDALAQCARMKDLGSDGPIVAAEVWSEIAGRKLDGLQTEAKAALEAENWPEARRLASELEEWGEGGRLLANEIRKQADQGEIEQRTAWADDAIANGDWAKAQKCAARLEELGAGDQASEVRDGVKRGRADGQVEKARAALAEKDWAAARTAVDELWGLVIRFRAARILAQIWWSRYAACGGRVLLLAVVVVVVALVVVCSSRQPCREKVASFFMTDTPTATTEAPTATPKPTTPSPTPTPSHTPTPTNTSTSEPPKPPMVEVLAGEFRMGSAETDPHAQPDDPPQSMVSVDTFWIDKYEVSNEQYRRCVEAGVCIEPTQCDLAGEPTYEDEAKREHPVVCVSQEDARAFCNWVGARLPTEAEWEKAASWDAEAGSKRVYPWGNEFTCGYFNFREALPGSPSPCPDDGYEKTAPLWEYPEGASPYGALNMAGNVMEWVDESGLRRGGAWSLGWLQARTVGRFELSADTRLDGGGFRCAQSSAP